MNAKNIISLRDASAYSGFGIDELKAMIDNGAITALSEHGEIYFMAKDLEAITPKEKLPEYKRAARWKGVGISISEAARVYDIPHANISHWKDAGNISVIGRYKNRVLVDRADVQYCVEMHKKYGGNGKRIFLRGGHGAIKSSALHS